MSPRQAARRSKRPVDDLGGTRGKAGLPKALPSKVFENSGLDAAYGTFAAVRNGDDWDRVVAKAACTAMNQGPVSTDSSIERAWERRIYSMLPDAVQPGMPSLGVPPGTWNFAVKASVTRVSRALAVSQMAPGGVFKYYMDYCF